MMYLENLLENLSAEVMGKFDSGQKMFSRKDVEILLARIQQLEIAAQQGVQRIGGDSPIKIDLSTLKVYPASKADTISPTNR